MVHHSAIPEEYINRRRFRKVDALRDPNYLDGEGTDVVTME